MKKFSFWSIIKWFTIICAIIVVLPMAINVLIELVCTKANINCNWHIEWSDWCSFIAVAIPSSLTCLVIKQSENQQNTNNENQARLERINERMLKMELKNHLGYFLPQINDDRIKAKIGRTVPYRYNLKDFLPLENAGDADIFVISTAVHHNRYINCGSKTDVLYISKQAPLNVLLVDLKIADDQLIAQKIDIELEIEMQNIKGYHYLQILYICFEKDQDMWVINRFNIELKELEDNAY